MKKDLKDLAEMPNTGYNGKYPLFYRGIAKMTQITKGRLDGTSVLYFEDILSGRIFYTVLDDVDSKEVISEAKELQGIVSEVIIHVGSKKLLYFNLSFS